MRVLVIGAKGMLGTDVVTEFNERGWQVTGVDRDEFDLTSPMDNSRLAHKEFGEFDWVVNCAAYTAVDRAEEDRDLAFSVNGYGPGLLAGACQMAEVKLIHISTDYVFDGQKTEPYLESDETNPQGAYGKSKLAGEEAVLALGGRVVRTSWLYGPNGPSFPRTMIRACRAGKSLRVVADQVGTPTSTKELAKVLGDLITAEAPPGIYHAAGPEIMTWHAFAELACTLDRGEPVAIEPIKSADWPTPTPRPAYSALSFSKVASLGIAPMAPVSESLRDFIACCGENLS